MNADTFPTFNRLGKWIHERLQRKSRSAGSAWALIETSNLPTPLKLAVQRFVERTRWRRKPCVALAQSMVSYFVRQLELGVSPETLEVQWNEIVPLPAFRRLREPSLVIVHSLPAPVMPLIDTVVRRTRLWRSEQIDVAREMVMHFQDGLEAGATSEQLIQDFGDVETTSQLIRRAKLRNRPLIWRTIRRTLQAIGILLVILIVWWSFLLIRFQFAKPKVTRDYIGEIDARSKALVESERAWPFYAEALAQVKLSPFTINGQYIDVPLSEDGTPAPEWLGLVKPIDVKRIDGRAIQMWNVAPEGAGAPAYEQDVHREYQLDMNEYSKGLDELSQSKYWPALVQFVQKDHAAIELVLQGAVKPNFGFIYRDPANAGWLKLTNASAYETFEKSSRSLLIGVLLPHMQYIRLFEHLLRIDAERARLEGDRERVVQILIADLRISAQLYRADEFLISKLCGIPFAIQSWNIIRKILEDQPDFFTDANLQTLAHAIAAYRMEVDLEFPWDLKPCLEDILQRLYTDDGDHDGHLTAEGWRLIHRFPEYAGTASFGSDSREKGSWPGQIQLEGSLMSGVVASRKELKQVLDHYGDLEMQATRQPLWETQFDGPQPASEFLERILSTTTGRIKYHPLLFLEPLLKPTGAVMNSHVHGECYKMKCDSTLIALGLTLYHRRNGSWPANLEQLSPELLPVVPLDRFDGKPMKYRLIEDKPVVYSVGRNKVDDGGKWDTETKPGFECLNGDWRLWPLRPGDK